MRLSVSILVQNGGLPFYLDFYSNFYLAAIINPSFQTNIGYISRGGHLLVKMGVIQWKHFYKKKKKKKAHSVRAFYFSKWGH